MLQTIKDSPLSSDRSLFSAMAVEEPSEDSAISMTTHLNEDDKEAPADEELTSLSWLQDTNLLKNFQVGEYGLEEEEEEESSNDCLEEVEHVEEVTAHHEVEELENEDVGGGGQNVAPYHPTLHSHSKPPFSFSCLIFMAIEDCPRKALPVKEIYSWILQHFPYFHTAPTGWKNSVRHNLSLSKCFRKVEKEKGQNVGKGSLWCIDPEFRPNLLQALQKAPSMANLEFSHFFSSSPRKGDSSEIKPCLLVSSQEAIQIPSPELFPFLSRRLASSMKDPEVDAAATMLTLKNGHPLHSETEYKRTAVCEESENDSVQNVQKFVRKRLRLKPPSSASKRSKKPVITSSPSEDHTYSACVEAGKQNGVTTLECNNNNVEEEGANALMNLAEIASKRLLRKVNNPSS